jgi:hypothetical protein
MLLFDEKRAHNQRRSCEQLLRITNPVERALFGVGRLSFDVSHHRNAGFEPRQSQRQLGKDDEGHGNREQWIAMLGRQSRRPARHGC